MQERACAVYIMASRRNGTLYTGVTSDLIRRVYEHKRGLNCAFTRKHRVTDLVWFEIHDWYEAARRREKAIKHWRRAWKLQLIEEKNPEWRDLYFSLA